MVEAIQRGVTWLGSVLAAMVLGMAGAYAEPVSRTVYFVDADDSRHAIGTLTFESASDNARGRFEPDGGVFKDQFLAMRPFKCYEGPKWSYCHFPFDSDADGESLLALEYQFMFMRKPRAAVNLDPTQGVFFKLEALGDHRYKGRLLEADMTPIIDPAAARDPKRPIRHVDLFDVATSATWMGRLAIE